VRWIEVSAAVAGLIGGVWVALTFLVDKSEDLIGTTDGNGIEVRQVVLANGQFGSRLVDGSFVQTDGSTPQVDITVRNTGKNPVLLTQARITIEDSTRLAVCEYSSGDVVASGKDYATELQVLPTPRERVVKRPLHQEVGPGAADRFRVLFRLSDPGQESYLYAVRVELVTDQGQQPVEVGRFVLGLPAPIVENGRILPEGDFEPGIYASERLASTWCLRRNLAGLKRLLETPGKRSPEVSDSLPFQWADWWQGFADHRSARAAVMPLLDSPVNEAPVLAVFAAEQTGDQQLVERTRERAAQLMLEQAKEALDSPYLTMRSAAEMLVRQAIALRQSPQAWKLLRQAETQSGVAEAASKAAEFIGD
jgi:archaellin